MTTETWGQRPPGAWGWTTLQLDSTFNRPRPAHVLEFARVNKQLKTHVARRRPTSGGLRRPNIVQIAISLVWNPLKTLNSTSGATSGKSLAKAECEFGWNGGNLPISGETFRSREDTSCPCAGLSVATPAGHGHSRRHRGVVGTTAERIHRSFGTEKRFAIFDG